VNSKKGESMTIPMYPAGPFTPGNCTVIAPPTNPAIRNAGGDPKKNRVCYNCSSVLIEHRENIEIQGILFQCADCTAYNQIEDSSKTPVDVPMDQTIYWASSAFRVPLSINQAIALGQFTAMWGQIDEMMLVCIAVMLKIDVAAAAQLSEGQTSGPRLNKLYELTKTHSNGKIAIKAKKVFSIISPLITKRNHLMHGMWGYHRSESGTVPACRYSKVNTPIPAPDVLKIMASTAAATKEMAQLLFLILGKPSPPDPNRPDMDPPFIFGDERDTSPETWLHLCASQYNEEFPDQVD
jgi:hypothetical protein